MVRSKCLRGGGGRERSQSGVLRRTGMDLAAWISAESGVQGSATSTSSRSRLIQE